VAQSPAPVESPSGYEPRRACATGRRTRPSRRALGSRGVPVVASRQARDDARACQRQSARRPSLPEPVAHLVSGGPQGPLSKCRRAPSICRSAHRAPSRGHHP
jgi:hypothetical protein